MFGRPVDDEQASNTFAGFEPGTPLLAHVEQLADRPESGSRPRELGRSRYRQVAEPPCRVFHRYDWHTVFVMYAMRTGRLLRAGQLASRARKPRV
jgi:hypothetical protein